MFIRFTTQFINEKNENETGVFMATGFLIRSEQMYKHDEKWLKEIREWFNKNLEKPSRFSTSQKKYASKVSLSWYKNSAIEHIKRMYDMKEVLEKYDLVVTVLKRKNPGVIVFEDEFQVSTIPFKPDRKKVK